MDTTVTLQDILVSREERAREQKRIIRKTGCPLICFTVVMPGPEKLNREARIIFEAGSRALSKSLGRFATPVWYELVKKTGHEGYYAVSADEKELKELTVSIEENHPLGSLFDMDVIGLSGEPVSRKEIGRPERKCLVCGGPAAVCVKGRAHAVEEIGKKISAMVAGYERTF